MKLNWLFPGDPEYGKDKIELAFCPTGKGGGVDPTCGRDGWKKTAKQLKKVNIDKATEWLAERGIEIVGRSASVKGATYTLKQGKVEATLSSDEVKSLLKSDLDLKEWLEEQKK